jgi:uncharacterized protein
VSYKGHLVVDADCHIREYWEIDRTYLPYIEPAYKEKYADFSGAVKARQKRPGEVGVGELLWPQPRQHPLGVYDAFCASKQERDDGSGPHRQVTHGGREIDPACHWDPAIRLRDMDEGNIDVSVMFASQSDGYCMLNDVGFESALQRAYHRFMSDYCAPGKGRLRWVLNSSMRDIGESLGQLKKWTAEDDNFAGAFLSRACPDGSMLDNPVLHPIFELSQELDMPIWIHGGAHRPPYTPWVEAPNPVYHGWGGQYALAALIGGGVFDLFPKLRIGIFESGAGWMPWLIEKLDDAYKPGSAMTPKLKRKPSEIVAGGQVFCSIECEEDHVDYAVETLGDHVWLLSTDYPHGGTSWPEGVKLVDQMKMPEAAKIKLFGENAVRFLPKLKVMA